MKLAMREAFKGLVAWSSGDYSKNSYLILETDVFTQQRSIHDWRNWFKKVSVQMSKNRVIFFLKLKQEQVLQLCYRRILMKNGVMMFIIENQSRIWFRVGWILTSLWTFSDLLAQVKEAFIGWLAGSFAKMILK